MNRGWFDRQCWIATFLTIAALAFIWGNALRHQQVMDELKALRAQTAARK